MAKRLTGAILAVLMVICMVTIMFLTSVQVNAAEGNTEIKSLKFELNGYGVGNYMKNITLTSDESNTGIVWIGGIMEKYL